MAGQFSIRLRTMAVALLGIASAASQSACNGPAADHVRSPIVALVNDRPITVSQLDQVTRANDSVAPAMAIESLINEELLVQAAEKRKLEHDTSVAQVIDASRRQILAREFTERILYPKQEASSDEAHVFFKANPILFEQRKRFLLKNFIFEFSGLDSQLAGSLENIHTDGGIRELLDRHDITYVTQFESIPAEQLPLDKLSEFEHASIGDVMMAHQSNGKSLLMLVTGIQNDTPLSFDRARPYIKAYLSSVRDREALNEYLIRAKMGAKIVYADAPKPGPMGNTIHDSHFFQVAQAEAK